jgi:hypothetical protein
VTGSGRRRTASACALVVLAAGCASDSPANACGREAEPQLSAVAVYGRHAAVRGKVDVRIANEGPQEVHVETYRIQHPLFESVPTSRRDSRLPADGARRIVPVPFGAPRCAADDAGEAVVVVGVRTGRGMREVVVPLADGEPGLRRAHRLACAAAAAAEAVELDLAPGTLVDGPVLSTQLQLRRRGPGEVAVTEVGGNILFSVDAPPSSPVVTLTGGQQSAGVALQVRATRCEAHALTESKRSFVFPAFVALDDVEPTQVQVAVSAPAQAALQELLDRTCTPGS